MRRSAIVLTVLLAVLLAGCAPGGTAPSGVSSPAGARTKVTIALDWLPNTNHTGLFVAQQQGWYADEGLDVTILPYSEGNQTDVLVATGQADFAISFEEAVTMARAAGQPVVSVAAVIQQNTSAFVTLRDSGLDRPAKLAGKRFAGYGAPFEAPVIEQVLKCDGAPTGQVQNITTSTASYQALVTKQADFAWVFPGWEGIQAKREGVALNVFPVVDYCVPNYYNPVIITSEREIKERPDVVRRFMRATSRGYEFAIAHPDQAADLLLQAAPPGSFPDPGLVKESAAWLAPRYQGGQARWGEQELRVWTDYPRFMIASGRLTDANGNTVTQDLDFARFFTNDFLPPASR